MSQPRLSHDDPAAADELRAAQLHEAETHYRALVEQSLVGVYLITNDRFVYVNDAVANITGYRVDELVGRLGPLDLVHPDDRALMMKNIQERLGGKVESIRYSLRCLRKDGTTGYCEVFGRRIIHEGQPAILGTLVDVTERQRAEEVLLQRVHELAALNRIGQGLNRLAEPAEILELIYTTIGQVLDNRNLFVALYDEAQHRITFPVYTIDGERRPPSQRAFGNGATEYVVRTKSPLLMSRDVTAALEARGVDFIGRQARSFLAVPMLAGERVIGVIAVQDYEREGVYDAHHAELLSTFAAQAAAALENARLYESTRRELEERRRAEELIQNQLETLTSLYASAQKLSQTLDLRQQADYVVEISVRVFGARICWIGVAEPDGSVRMVTHFPREREYPRQITVRWDDSPLGQGPTGRVIRSGFPVIIHDIATDPGFSQHREAALAEGSCCVGVFPLINREKPFGALILHSDQPGFFTPARVDFFQAFAHLAAAALENARLFEETGRRLEHLQALRDIDTAISGSLDGRVTMNIFLDKVTAHLRVDAASVLLLNPHTQTLEFAVGRGFRTPALQHTRLRLGHGYAGRAALERRILSIPNLAEAPGELERSQALLDEGFLAYFAAPLIAKGQICGVLEIFHRGALSPDVEWMDFLGTLAGQAAIAIDSTTMFDNLQRANVHLAIAYDATLEGWSRALDLRDKETEGHTQRVAELTVRLARMIGMNDEQLVHVRRGALLHDIGKMGIPDSILLKPGPLTDEEWVIMRKHPVHAYELLSPIPYLRPALDIPYCHHEKWDGSGYPRGLVGEQIPLAARIFAVADVWDALRSDRPYRPAWPEKKARAYIQEQAGKHFDPSIVEIFLGLEPPTSSDGER